MLFLSSSSSFLIHSSHTLKTPFDFSTSLAHEMDYNNTEQYGSEEINAV